ncbi:HlyC/CorC family transporter [Desertihabitans brevis]|uniref:HlyC/CorC family transporter n=1 Tax=Desertihabitans brevis TaxID=2268447 RepID=A0A367YTZ2_9ACTN|nr:hemolysin family protein [Desertihabitans brevis]RCK69363.1 HlyC/CorC family transporter [Desertihabitans brevis]
MSQTSVVLLVVAGVLTVLAGVLAAAESALTAFSKARAQELVDEGRAGAARLLKLLQDPAPYLNTALFLRTICEITAIVLVADVVFGLIGAAWLQWLLTAGVMIVVSFLLWGVAPRTLGRQHADRVAVAMAGPLSALTTVLGPVPQLLILLGNAITPGRGFSDGPFSSEAELRELVDMAEASELIEARERRMIHSVFELGDTIVKEVMVPRTEIVSIEEDKSLRQAISLALRSGYSRIPVTRGGLDEVVGVVYLKDLMRRQFDNPRAETSEKVSKVMRDVVWVPDSKPVDALLREMQLTRSHLVMVVDEFGGTAGLATIEDILEEIVGEIVDEYDREVDPVTELEPGRYRVTSRLAVDEVGELFGLRLEDEDVDSIGGLLAKHLGRVPIDGSTVVVEGLELVAERATGRRKGIGTVLVSRAPAEEDVPAVEEDVASVPPAEVGPEDTRLRA